MSCDNYSTEFLPLLNDMEFLKYHNEPWLVPETEPFNSTFLYGLRNERAWRFKRSHLGEQLTSWRLGAESRFDAAGRGPASQPIACALHRGRHLETP